MAWLSLDFVLQKKGVVANPDQEMLASAAGSAEDVVEACLGLEMSKPAAPLSAWHAGDAAIPLHRRRSALGDRHALVLAHPISLRLLANPSGVTVNENGVSLPVKESQAASWPVGDFVALSGSGRLVRMTYQSAASGPQLKEWQPGDGNILVTCSYGYDEQSVLAPKGIREIARDIAWIIYRDGKTGGSSEVQLSDLQVRFQRLLNPYLSDLGQMENMSRAPCTLWSH